MARRVFFSFHYERDIWRANVVRNSWVTHSDRQSSGFWDASLWEEAKLKGKKTIQNLIDNGLNNTSVTVVLIGAEAADREYVQYEIRQSVERGKGLLGVRIHQIADGNGYTDKKGTNPFNEILVHYSNGETVNLSKITTIYDWFADDGYANLGVWVEHAAQIAGK